MTLSRIVIAAATACGVTVYAGALTAYAFYRAARMARDWSAA